MTLLPYAPDSGVAKKKKAAAESTDFLDEIEDNLEESDTEKDDISNNAMIKVIFRFLNCKTPQN